MLDVFSNHGEFQTVVGLPCLTFTPMTSSVLVTSQGADIHKNWKSPFMRIAEQDWSGLPELM